MMEFIESILLILKIGVALFVAGFLFSIGTNFANIIFSGVWFKRKNKNVRIIIDSPVPIVEENINGKGDQA